jgi:hypothetical protein
MTTYVVTAGQTVSGLTLSSSDGLTVSAGGTAEVAGFVETAFRFR